MRAPLKPAYRDIVHALKSNMSMEETIKRLCSGMQHDQAKRACIKIKAIYETAETINKLLNDGRHRVFWNNETRVYGCYIQDGPNFDRIYSLSGKQGNEIFVFMNTTRVLWQYGWIPDRLKK